MKLFTPLSRAVRWTRATFTRRWSCAAIAISAACCILLTATFLGQPQKQDMGLALLAILAGSVMVLGLFILVAVALHTEATTHRALRESEALLSEMGEIAQVGGWRFDAATGQGVWTPEVARIHDLDPATVISRDQGLDYYVGESRELIRQAVAEAMQGTPYDLELELQSATGRHKWVHTIGHPVVKDGKVVEVWGSMQDITERKRSELALLEANDLLEKRVAERTAQLAEVNAQLREEIGELDAAQKALRKAESMLQLVMDTIPESIFWKDRDGLILGCNNRMAQELGYATAAEVVGKTDYELAVPELADSYVADDKRVMETDLPVLNIVERLRSPEGGDRWIRTHKLPLHDADGSVMGVLGCFIDITREQVAAEELRQAREVADAANHSKSEFLSRMSHELRTPLNAILGFGQILEMRQLPDKDRVAVEHILRAGQHLLQLIDEVLDISRIEAGKLNISLEPILLSDIIRPALEMMAPLAAARSITIHNELGPLAGQTISVDPQRFRQVVINLLSNAIKYNRAGGSVTLRAETAGEELRLLVQDTGRGLNSAQIARLFMPFERLNAANSEVEGTGIGLFLSRRLMDSMGGSVGITEQPSGQGCLFWVQTPLAQSAGPQGVDAVATPVAVPAPPASISTQTVLYIEDNLSNLRLIEVVLDEYGGARLVPALQGSIGLELAGQCHPDLILLDLNLPDMNGREVLKRLRDIPATVHTPVVVLSADAMPDQVARLLEEGALAYLTKPIDLPRFLEILGQVLGGGATPPNEREP